MNKAKPHTIYISKKKKKNLIQYILGKYKIKSLGRDIQIDSNTLTTIMEHNLAKATYSSGMLVSTWDEIHWMLGKVFSKLIGIGNYLETSYIKH